MNITFKTSIALGAAGLSLLALAGTAGAQTTAPDPNLTTVFSTVATGRTPSFATGAPGIGFDALGGNGSLPNSPSAATAQSVYDAFTFDSSAAGTFSTLASGTQAQIQIFGVDQNVAAGAAAATFNVYASLYAFNPNAAAGTVPVMGSNLFGGEQKVTIGAIQGGYFSGDFNLTGAVTAGQKYVLGITTLTGDTQDFGQIAVSPFSTAGLATADQAADAVKYLTTANDQGNPTGQTFMNPGGFNVVSFRLGAAVGAPVPEASSVVSLGLMLGMGAAFIAFKRRRSVAK